MPAESSPLPASGSGADRLYSRLVRRDRDTEADLPAPVRRNVPANGLRLVGANALQSSGDQAVNPSTVLPWLFSVLGVPTGLVGLLVPIRESGSMLPQALLTPLVVRPRRRKAVFVAGAGVQAASVAVMAGVAALAPAWSMPGWAAGTVVLLALAVFSLGRCLCSIASKDVQGRVLPSGERGQVNGLATTAAGLVAITLGVGLRVLGGEDLSAAALAWVLAAAAGLWVGVAAVYATVREPAEDPQEQDGPRRDGGSALPRGGAGREETGGQAKEQASSWALLREDAEFRRFVTTRGLLLVSSLAPPFVVMLALSSGSDALAGLGGFVIASGLASLLGGRLFGRAADRSPRLLMAGAAAAACVAAVAVVVATWLPGFRGGSWAGTAVFVGGYFLLALAHTGVRVGRKTYLVDMASGDTRTRYTAVSNTAMGVLLLAVGAVSSAVAAFGAQWALLLLAALGAAGVVSGLRLKEVSAG